MKKIILGLIAISVIAYACSKTNKDKVTNPADEGPKITSTGGSSRNLPTPAQLNSYLGMHNAFMTDIFNGQIIAEDEIQLAQALKPYVGFVATADFTDQQFNTVLANHYQTYAGLTSSGYVQQLLSSQAVTPAEGVVLSEIVNNMELADYSNLQNFIAELNEYTQSPNYVALPDSSRQLIDMFATVYRNSANLYHPYTLDIPEEQERTAISTACKKCLKDNIKWILIGDAAGVITGVVGCIVFWPACAYILPALIAYGSGGAIWFYCRGKC